MHSIASASVVAPIGLLKVQQIPWDKDTPSYPIPPGVGREGGPESVVLKTKTDVLKRKITDIVLWLLWNIPAVGLSVIEMVLILSTMRLDS